MRPDVSESSVAFRRSMRDHTQQTHRADRTAMEIGMEMVMVMVMVMEVVMVIVMVMMAMVMVMEVVMVDGDRGSDGDGDEPYCLFKGDNNWQGSTLVLKHKCEHEFP